MSPMYKSCTDVYTHIWVDHLSIIYVYAYMHTKQTNE